MYCAEGIFDLTSHTACRVAARSRWGALEYDAYFVGRLESMCVPGIVSHGDESPKKELETYLAGQRGTLTVSEVAEGLAQTGKNLAGWRRELSHKFCSSSSAWCVTLQEWAARMAFHTLCARVQVARPPRGPGDEPRTAAVIALHQADSQLADRAQAPQRITAHPGEQLAARPLLAFALDSASVKANSTAP